MQMPARLLLVCCLLVGACAPAGNPPTELQYLGQTRVWPGATHNGTVIGGLSGISYDGERQLYYIVSDDRSARNPARFYTARIALADNGIDDIEFVGTAPWRDVDGMPFAPLDTEVQPAMVPPDPEGIAVDAGRQRLYWSSEGERLTDGPKAVLADPWVRIADFHGRYLGEFRLPLMLHMSAGEAGPRRNSGLEGLALGPNGAYLWAAMEGPGHQDGASPTEHEGALTRVTKFDVESEEPIAQYAYPLDPVSSGPGGDNGVSAMVALDDQNFLVVERGYGTHVAARIYRAHIGEATDVLRTASLQGSSVTAMSKTLMADLTQVPGLTPLDNIEGITLGPVLPDGRQSVLLVSDDNFSPTQATQFVAFAFDE